MVERFEREMKKQLREELQSGVKVRGKLTRWERYRELKEGAIPEPEKLIGRIKMLADAGCLKVAAAISLLLLTGSRIQEIVRYKWVWVRGQKDATGKKIPMDYEQYKRLKDVTGEVIAKPGVRLSDIEEREIDNQRWLVIKTRVEKYHDVSKTFYKTAWLLCDEQEYYYPLIKILEEYADTYFTGAPEGTELFTFSDEYLRKEIAKHLDLTPHILRNYAAKYLVWKKGFTVQDLMKWFQWKGVEQALSYSSSDEATLRGKMSGNT